ncbi:hypothetical protein ACHAW6_010134 [Cyclotella cf. meneghiniana]
MKSTSNNRGPDTWKIYGTAHVNQTKNVRLLDINLATMKVFRVVTRHDEMTARDLDRTLH